MLLFSADVLLEGTRTHNEIEIPVHILPERRLRQGYCYAGQNNSIIFLNDDTGRSELDFWTRCSFQLCKMEIKMMH